MKWQVTCLWPNTKIKITFDLPSLLAIIYPPLCIPTDIPHLWSKLCTNRTLSRACQQILTLVFEFQTWNGFRPYCRSFFEICEENMLVLSLVCKGLRKDWENQNIWKSVIANPNYINANIWHKWSEINYIVNLFKVAAALTRCGLVFVHCFVQDL